MDLILTAAGLVLLIAGLICVFGAWAAVVCGAVLLTVGLLIDFGR